MQSDGFSFFEIDHASPYLDDVIRLWRAYSDTLGPFPRGAFEEYAQKRQIIVATDCNSKIIGYLTYRYSRHTVSIVHFCVEQQIRGNGVARKIFDCLRTKVQHADDIRLTCRRDFEANRFWPRLGFEPVYEKPGRGRERRPLTIWRYQIRRAPLLDAMYRSQLERKAILAAIDANVFYDLQHMNNEETNGLTADFIDEAINLCVTGEMKIEINRQSDPQIRKTCQSFLNKFESIDASPDAVEELFSKLKSYHPRAAQLTETDRSDLRHLAFAILGGASIFITRDDTLLKFNEEIHREHGINILRPCDVILHLDEIQREESYRPQRLSVSGFKLSRMQSGELERVISLIREPTACGRNEVSDKLRSALSRPADNECFIIKNQKGETSAIYCLDFSVGGRLNVPVLRILAKSLLSNTLARCVLEMIIGAARQREIGIVTISMETIQPEFQDALREHLFLGVSNPTKICLPLVDTHIGIATSIGRISDKYSDLREVTDSLVQSLHELNSESTAFDILEIEKMLWPAKIIDDRVQNFVVPIRAKWAQELFDSDLAKQTLFGAQRAELIFNTENVYYRHSRPRVLTEPARVLWYVSSDAKYQGTKGIRACSYVDEVLIGNPKDLFRQFRRLGVYQWDDVFKLADSTMDGELMAFRFSRTELFPHPIEWETLQEILIQAKGKKSQFQCPELISSQAFLQLYRLGTAKA